MKHPLQKAWHSLWRLFWQFRLRWTRQGTQVGDRIPNFTLTDVEGRPYRLYDAFPEKGVVLWLTNLCEGCEEKIPFMKRLHHEQQKALQIIAISILGDDLILPRRIREKHQIDFPLLIDPEDWVEKKLGLPHPMNVCPMFNLLVVNSVGKVAYRTHLSAIPERKLEEIVQSIIKNRSSREEIRE